jgi:branched-chain amino acid transport system ATP-binding protein
MPLLELSGLAAGYSPGQPVLDGIELSLDSGEIVTLIGANGAGKSTLVKSISGVLKPSAGTVIFDGVPIGSLSSAQRLRRGIAHVPEGRQIFAGMTVAENLDLGAYADIDARRKAQRLDYVCTLFPILRDRLGDVAGNFSGGQQQMLAIARGLMSRPRVLLLDEPSLGVAPLLVAEIFALISRLRDEGLGILLAEQNARAALAIADRGYVVETGTIALSGVAKDLLHSPEIAERYLGVGAASTFSAANDRQTAERLRAAVW